MYSTGAQTTQGSITVPVGKDMRMKNIMLGWFQFQHEDGTADSWTIDDVNITLSLDSTSGGSEGTATGSDSSSGSSAVIYGVIAGVVVAVIVVIIILVIVIVKMRSRDKYDFNPTKSVMQTEFQNPLYGPMEGIISFDQANVNDNEENHNDN